MNARHYRSSMKNGLAAALVSVAGLLVAGTASAEPPKTEAKAAATQDVLIFRNGNVLQGKIISETPTTIVFEGLVSGMAFKTEYPRSEILEVKKGAAPAAAAPTAPAATTPEPTKTPVTETPAADGVPGQDRVYWIELAGKFGQDISETPLRNALKDAKNQKADAIVIELNNSWKFERGRDKGEDIPEFLGSFDALWRAEAMLPALTTELQAEWEKPPRLIFWVRNAMGGMAFLPLISSDLYFHPEGRLGGVGDLSNIEGHTRVVEKQISLRRQHAVGWLNRSGYPYPELLIRGLAEVEVVVSVRFKDNRPVLFEGYPTNPSEELLTDDGMEGNADSIQALARGEGNDVLTLNERTAKLIGLSKGTVDTRDALMYAVGYTPAQIVNGRSEKIFKDWTTGLESAHAQLRRLMEEFQDIQVEGDWNERKQARSSQISKLEQMRAIIRRWKESIDMYRLAQAGYPVNGDLQANLQEWQDNIRTAQLLDKK
jgi:hypothetical protein